MPVGPIMSALLEQMKKHNASDLYITVGSKPCVRNNNTMIPISQHSIRKADMQKFIGEILDDDKKGEFESTLELNITIIAEDNARYRANFFMQQENAGMVVRRIQMHVPTIEELGLPDIYAKSIMKKRGLLILASPGGSGKSTSMAAMIGHRNRNSSGHILTIEDPIEFIHRHEKCIITQREVGTDTYSYGMALKNALRQRADVIAIGEIRDKESLEHALRFAETGHLCVATLHSNNSYQAIARMVNLFPDEARQYVLATISQNLIAIFSQRIIPTIKAGNTVVPEIMLNEGLIKNLIHEDRLNEIKEAMERARDAGMQTFDQGIFNLYETGIISAEVAIAESDNPAMLKLKIAQESSGNIPPIQMSIIDKDEF